MWNFARFGSTTRVPTLWLYAENDGWFRPALVSRLRAAYTGAGEQAELVVLPPFGSDGHALFYAEGGKQRRLPELDRFLRMHGLPTWDQDSFAPLLARLSPADWQLVENYLAQPSELLAADVALVTYRAQRAYSDGTRSASLRSSIWQRQGGAWQMVFHQGTPTTALQMDERTRIPQ